MIFGSCCKLFINGEYPEEREGKSSAEVESVKYMTITLLLVGSNCCQVGNLKLKYALKRIPPLGNLSA